MNQEDILKMAREAGAGAMKTWNMRQESDPVTAYRFTEEAMERFAARVAAKAAEDEREACAKVADRHFRDLLDLAGDDLPAAIRARGQ